MKRIVCLVVTAAMTAVGCNDQPAAPNASEKPPAMAESLRFSQQHQIAPDMFAVVHPVDAERSSVEAAARQVCRGEQWCKVFGWTDAAFAATAMPMTDREVSAQTFTLTINRASGMDEVVWN